MLRNLFKDWKTLLGLLFAAGAIYVSIWVYQADLNSKSLAVQIVSQVALKQKLGDAMQGMEFTLDGKSIDLPHLTVIQVTSDGRRPITSADFESPFEIRVDSASKLIRAQLSSKSPSQLEPKLVQSGQAVTVSPMLLNAGDTFSLAIITSGSNPQFAPFARIVGVPKVELLDTAGKKVSKTRTFVVFLAAFSLLVTSFVLSDGTMAKAVVVRRRASIFCSFSTLFVGQYIAMGELDDLQADTQLQIAIGILVFIFSVVTASLLNRKISEVK